MVTARVRARVKARVRVRERLKLSVNAKAKFNICHTKAWNYCVARRCYSQQQSRAIQTVRTPQTVYCHQRAACYQ
jgi:hypothetical protein